MYILILCFACTIDWRAGKSKLMKPRFSGGRPAQPLKISISLWRDWKCKYEFQHKYVKGL